MRKILAIMLVLAVSVTVANAQFEMVRTANINNQLNYTVKPAITNDLSYLGEAYTMGTNPTNLTGNYSDFFVFRLYQSPSSEPADIWIDMNVYDGNGVLNTDLSETLKPDLGMRSTLGVSLNLEMVFAADALKIQLSGLISETIYENLRVFDLVGGFVDYVAYSGAGGNVTTTGFQFGNGWVDPETRNHGLVNMQVVKADGVNASGNFTFGSGATSCTFTSKAVAWNENTGVALKGSLATGGFLGLQGWTQFSLMLGTFERVPVPEPATLLMLGCAAAGLPLARRFRRK